MRRSLRYDRRALEDIEVIFAFIAEDDEMAAMRVAARIRTAADQLASNPMVGRSTNLPAVRARSIVNYPYLLFYTFSDDEVVILHVRHTARKEPDDLGL